jgi:hypothetical protein|tara:strand:+ start:1471 stop:2112 length:642 start_codon:yes stop_codon:yes gene_type:complete
MLFHKIITFILLNIVDCFNVCIVGANGGLGRELVYQSIKNYNYQVLGLTSKPYCIYEPFRGNGFENVGLTPEFKSNNLFLENYWNKIPFDYEHIIFCTGSQPLEKDYSDKLTKKFISNLSKKCKSISLVSAYGVNENLKYSNIGVKILEKLFLTDSYRAKSVQEVLILHLNKDIKKYIYKPKALSYGFTYLESTTRQELAEEILERINLGNRY